LQSASLAVGRRLFGHRVEKIKREQYVTYLKSGLQIYAHLPATRSGIESCGKLVSCLSLNALNIEKLDGLGI
jgi:hypothetical protein